MTKPFMPAMATAAALTRAGKLTEATALIQSMLQQGAPTAAAEADAQPSTSDIIEGEFTAVAAAPPPLTAS